MFKASHVLQSEFLNRISDAKAADFFPVISANYSVDEAAYLTELLELADPVKPASRPSAAVPVP